jgi:hypothetical protein
MSVRRSVALLGPALYCLLTMAGIAAPASVFAQPIQPAPPSASSCPAGSAFTASFKAASARGEVHVARLLSPSLHQAEASLLRAAEGLLRAPQLFEINLGFDDFLHRGPYNSVSVLTANYASSCDQAEFLSLGRSVSDNGETAWLGQLAFVVHPSCAGGAPPGPFGPNPITRPPSEPEPESNHSPVLGWTVDLPQLWNIVKSHEVLFAKGVESCVITTAARLKKTDGIRSSCYEGKSFKTSNGAAKRLANEQGQRAVIELVEYGLQLGQCQQGHYLIVDAHTGVDLESGTFNRCFYPPA